MNGPVASLNTAWFALIGVLWTGYFVLEGFDFGVGMLNLAIGRDDVDRRLCRNAIGPVWDGNEVWLIVAAGATFRRLSRLVRQHVQRLLPRAVHRAGRPDRAGRQLRVPEQAGQRPLAGRWDWAMAVGSLLPAFAWGVAFTDLVHGLPLSPAGLYQGSFWGLLAPVAIVGGLASLAMFLAHGATFLALKTAGPLAERARKVAMWVSPLAGALVVGTAAWLAAGGSHGPGALGGTVPIVLAAVCGLAFAAAGALVLALGRPGVRAERTGDRGRHGRGFHRALPPGDGLERSRPVADHLERGFGARDPARHDRGRGDLRAARAGLPGLDLLGLPAAADQARRAARSFLPTGLAAAEDAIRLVGVGA